MPFQSDAQRRFMYAQHPGIAKRWAKHTPKGKDLPEKKTDSDPEETKALDEQEKKAFVKNIWQMQLGLIKNASTLEDSDIAALAAGGVGAGLPITAGVQDYLKGVDLRKAVSNLDDSKFVSHAKLKKIQQLGDIGATMRDYAKYEADPTVRFLGGNSARLGGVGFGHGFVVGPKNKIFHGGSILGLDALPLPGGKNIRSQRLIPEMQEVLNTLNETGVVKGLLNPSKTWKKLKGAMLRTDYGAESVPKNWAKHLNSLSPQAVTQAEDFAAILRPTQAYTSHEKDLIKNFLQRSARQQYDTPNAVLAGLNNILFPRLNIGRDAKSLTAVCDSRSSHCGMLPTKLMQILGKATRGTSNLLPSTMFDNPNFALEAIAGKGKPAAIRAEVLANIAKSMKGRAGIGLAAAAGLGGASALAGKYLTDPIKNVGNDVVNVGNDVVAAFKNKFNL